MYEYIADIERWKIINEDYVRKYNLVKDYVNICISKCKIENCREMCKKPIIEIEKFNSDLFRNATLDIYELCTKKTKDIKDLTLLINKTKKCVEVMYNDNENIIKREMIERIDDVYKFLSLD